MADSAGTIASRSGNATVAPTPRRNVRRGSAILVMIMCLSLPWLSRESCGLALLDLHPERVARGDPDNNRGERVLVPRRLLDDPPDDRLVVIIQPSAQSID